MSGVQNFALIVFAFLLILLMQALPVWLVGLAIALVLWKAWILRTGTGQPSRVLISALGTLMLALVFLDPTPILSREAMIALVCIASLLFLLDRPHLRQVMLVHGAFYGLLISLLVMRGSPLPLFLYFFLTVLIFFSLMIHHLPPAALFSLWPLGRNIMKISLPVAAILLPIYFFFPEIRPQNADYAVSGLSDILEPGRIARLALSDRVAFRVRFQGDLPDQLHLYWRSSVLEESFGMIWRKKRLPDMQEYTKQETTGRLSYEIIPDTRMGLSLPLLEQTIAATGMGRQPTPIWWHPDLRIFQSQNDIIVASATLQDRFLPSTQPVREELKIEISDRLKLLVNELRTMSDADRVNFLLERFKGFTYTLRPGALSRDDALDDFLFEKKQGFCEHFAAAFGSLLQLAGTPARVITGYEGGVFIGSSNFMVIRDSDAHAWTEVFLDGRWQRIDPSAVAMHLEPRTPAEVWITSLPSAWFAYGIRWTVTRLREWTAEFNYLWLGLTGVLLVIVPIQLWRMQQKRLNRPLWQTAMERFLLDLQKRGLLRERHEGMRDFLGRVAKVYPQEEKTILALTQLYLDVLYGPGTGRADAESLRRSFQELRRLLKRIRA